ncbi:hypothetical protein DDE82_003352 [Stemphylium lycopersici]|uniref:Uncharacterized protein n=1 Tax=Stemphylium lycopersici TaxID=183478 RepID=A0A364NFD0_STELY|nr:hypothetical protein TW65_08529 [Stemphylium lycopersici]RAR06531.1 hypothetical protein DDE82_003352 [Stemphylium lycopersici]RAR15813.1 hypothetical protein DDE83_000829 [Stemphylium lycopersici]
MRFITLSFPLFAAAAAAQSFVGIGLSWNVTRSSYIISQQVTGYDLTAVFVSEEYPDGLVSKCMWAEKAGLPLTHVHASCVPDTFSAEVLANGTMKLQQLIDKPVEQLVFGQGDLPRDGHVVIDVSSSIA